MDDRPSLNPKLPDYWSGSEGALRVGLCQVRTAAWDLEGNTERALAAIREASDAGADLAITPECVFHGYGMLDDEHDLEAALEAAEPLDGARISSVRELADRLELSVLLGFAEATADGRICNAAALIGPDGELLSVYRKVHLRDFEDAAAEGYFSAGNEFSVTPVEVRGMSVPIGTMICFDRELPEAVRVLRALGAWFVPCPLATNTERLDGTAGYANDELITQARAAENELFVAVVNHAGRFNGGTFLVGPGGEVVVQLGSEEEVRVVEIPVAAVPALQADPVSWKAWEFRRPEVYGRYLDAGSGQ